jgi:hypothetical protein
MRRLSLLCGAIGFGLVVGASAAIISVPHQYPTIQAGIDAAVDGDTVLVAAGTYTGDGNRDIDYLGKAIVVMSESGPEATVIDCQGVPSDPHRGFHFHSGEDSNSVLQEFTVTNGHTPLDWLNYHGGAIFCDGASPTIVGNTFTGNTAVSAGGGIDCRQGASPVIVDNIFTGNWARYGGGISCYVNASPRIEGNIITDNTADHRGGGIACWEFSSPTVEGNTITGNTTSLTGGGMWCGYFSSPTVKGNTIAGNSVGLGGGGFHCYWNSSPVITGTTIAGNRAVEYGGAFFCIYNSSPIVINSILWGDSASTDSEIYLTGKGSIDVLYSDVEGGWEGEGNIDADPLFVLPGSHDYRLLWGSSCIDAGHPDSLDPDGTRSDMGAFSFNQVDSITLYLTPDKKLVRPGGELGVAYTLINRWSTPASVWLRSTVNLPCGGAMVVVGPKLIELDPVATEQRHVLHPVPSGAPARRYEYECVVGVPLDDTFDEDSFQFWVQWL